MPTKAARRPIRSDTPAQRMRPPPLKSPMTPTSVAAPTAEKPATSVAVPAATEMKEMPAVTEIVRMSVRRYHCGVRIASCWVKSRPAAGEVVASSSSPAASSASASTGSCPGTV